MKKNIRFLFISFSFLATITTAILANLPLVDGTWYNGFTLLLLNALLFLNVFIFFIALFTIRYLCIVVLLSIGLSYNSVIEIFSFNIPTKSHTSKNKLSVLSYNVASFNTQRFQKFLDTLDKEALSTWLDKHSVADEQLTWLGQQTADIVCFQEFYNNDNRNSEKTHSKAHEYYQYSYTSPVVVQEHEGFFGVAIFSRFPIVNYGNIGMDTTKTTLNKAVYADILTPRQDTLRIINIHLESMSIRFTPLLASNSYETFVAALIDIISKLRNGFGKRKQQIDSIVRFVAQSPHKVILCGDFNDIPLSYTYRSMKKQLLSSFEKAGWGFGFTCNRRPYWIRIDHLFHSASIQAINCQVLRENKQSDHFPVYAEYVWE